MCMNVLPKCTYVYHLHVWWLQRPEEGIRSLETGVKIESHHVHAGN